MLRRMGRFMRLGFDELEERGFAQKKAVEVTVEATVTVRLLGPHQERGQKHSHQMPYRAVK